MFRFFSRECLRPLLDTEFATKLLKSNPGAGHEAAAVHHTHRGRGCVAARGAGAAAGEDEADRDGFSIRTRRKHGRKLSSVLSRFF